MPDRFVQPMISARMMGREKTLLIKTGNPMRLTICLMSATIAMVLFVSTTCWSQEPEGTERTVRPEASIEDVAWIAGHWNGEALGGIFEETWNPPVGDSMMGMFKLVDNGTVKFYELLTIVPEGNSLVLRLKHFDDQLVGWEKKEDSVEFPLSSVSDSEVKFEGLTFKRINDQKMVVTVQTEQKDRQTQEIKSSELRFECHRVGADNTAGAQAAIDQVLALDSVLSKQRDRLPEKHTLATAVQAYVFGLENIDFSQCPDEFTQAFKHHREAWNNSISFFEKHDQRRGEMHAVIEEIRKLDSTVVAELDQCMRPIFETWQQVEKAAKTVKK